MENNAPSPHIEGKFKVVGVVPGPVLVPKTGTVDLRYISLKQAEELHAKDFPYLEKIEAAATTVKPKS